MNEETYTLTVLLIDVSVRQYLPVLLNFRRLLTTPLLDGSVF